MRQSIVRDSGCRGMLWHAIHHVPDPNPREITKGDPAPLARKINLSEWHESPLRKINTCGLSWVQQEGLNESKCASHVDWENSQSPHENILLFALIPMWKSPLVVQSTLSPYYTTENKGEYVVPYLKNGCICIWRCIFTLACLFSP